MAKYKVQLAKNFELPTRWRAGRQFTRNEPQILELTKEEVEAIKNDRYMEIKKTTAADIESNAGTGEDQSSTTGTAKTEVNPVTDPTPAQDGDPTDDTLEDQGPQTTDQTAQSPAVSNRDKLLRKSRKAVNKLAENAGVENPQDLPNKEVVVDALLAKQGE